MKRAYALLGRNKRHLATVALVVGFIVDVITFRNLNIAYALAILGAHLFVVACSILVLSLPTPGEGGGISKKLRAWLPVAHQYSTGALLSAFLVLYSASGSFAASWPFLLLVLIAALGNEVFRLKKYLLPFQTSLFFLNMLLFTALLLPYVANSMSVLTFVLASVFALVVFQVFLWLLRFAGKSVFDESRRTIRRSALAIFVALNVFYFTNVIPPIPLTLQHAGFYHSVERSGGAYIATEEERSWLGKFFDISGTTVRFGPDERLYALTSVFAPGGLDTNIVHRFEYYDQATNKWVLKSAVEFPILGGRKGGYRGYSFVHDPEAGRWRLSVETARGQVLGRVYADVERLATPPPLKSIRIE